MTNLYQVYLAGKIDGLTLEEANRQRKIIAEKLLAYGIKCRNPLRGRSSIFNGNDLVNATSVKELNITIQEIIQRDLNDINLCNVVLILTGDEPSWGTTAEFWYSTFVIHKPTLVISRNNYDIEGSNWVKHFATKVVPDIDSAIAVLKEWKLYWDNGDKVYEQE